MWLNVDLGKQVLHVLLDQIECQRRMGIHAGYFKLACALPPAPSLRLGLESKSNGKDLAKRVQIPLYSAQRDVHAKVVHNWTWMVGASTRRGCLGMALSMAHCRIKVSVITSPNVPVLGDKRCRLHGLLYLGDLLNRKQSQTT
jgi:hypothetical protein